MEADRSGNRRLMGRRDFLVAGVAALAAGCSKQTYRVLTDLPAPPRGTDEANTAYAFSPQDPAAVIPAAAGLAGTPAPQGPPGWQPQIREVPWRYIVVHHSSTETGNSASFDATHRGRGWDELGYHFVVTNGQGSADGLVEVGGRWTKQKWGAHTGGTPNNEYNDYGIGVCLVGDFMTRMPSDRQLASLDTLVRFLMARYGIGPGAVLGHRDAPSAKTGCPGDRLHEWLHGRFIPSLRRPAANA